MQLGISDLNQSVASSPCDDEVQIVAVPTLDLFGEECGLDLPDASLAQLDLVVAAVHSHFDLPRDQQTDRIMRAMDNRHVSILAHPTGRLIGEREPYDVDMDRIATAARDTGCCLEINAEPDRLDLNDIHAHAAKSKGAKLAVSTDAHSVNAFQYLRFGIDQARRGWLTADDVINTRSLGDLRKLLKRWPQAAFDGPLI